MAFSVENRMALALLFFRMDRLASVIPTRSDSSFRDIFRLAIMTSRLITIMRTPPYTVRSFSDLISVASAMTFFTTRRHSPTSSATKATA